MEWIPETEPFLEYESLKDIINESIGTITLNKDYTKEFIEKVVDDINRIIQIEVKPTTVSYRQALFTGFLL